MNFPAFIIICTFGTFVFFALGYSVFIWYEDKNKKTYTIAYASKHVLHPDKCTKPQNSWTNRRNRRSKRFLFDASESSTTSIDCAYYFYDLSASKNKRLQAKNDEISDMLHENHFVARNYDYFTTLNIPIQSNISNSSLLCTDIKKSCSMNCEAVKSFMECSYITIKIKYDCFMQINEYHKLSNYLIDLERLIAYFYFTRHFKENIFFLEDLKDSKMDLQSSKKAFFDIELENLNLLSSQIEKLISNIRDTIFCIIGYHLKTKQSYITIKKTISSNFRFDQLNEIEYLKFENVLINKSLDFNTKTSKTENKNTSIKYNHFSASPTTHFFKSENQEENIYANKNTKYKNSQCRVENEKVNVDVNTTNYHFQPCYVENKDRIDDLINTIINFFEERTKKIILGTTKERIIKEIKIKNLETLWRICDECKIIIEMAIFELIPIEDDRNLRQNSVYNKISGNINETYDPSLRLKNKLSDNSYQKKNSKSSGLQETYMHDAKQELGNTTGKGIPDPEKFAKSKCDEEKYCSTNRATNFKYKINQASNYHMNHIKNNSSYYTAGQAGYDNDRDDNMITHNVLTESGNKNLQRNTMYSKSDSSTPVFYRPSIINNKNSTNNNRSKTYLGQQTFYPHGDINSANELLNRNHFESRENSTHTYVNCLQNNVSTIPITNPIDLECSRFEDTISDRGSNILNNKLSLPGRQETFLTITESHTDDLCCQPRINEEIQTGNTIRNACNNQLSDTDIPINTLELLNENSNKNLEYSSTVSGPLDTETMKSTPSSTLSELFEENLSNESIESVIITPDALDGNYSQNETKINQQSLNIDNKLQQNSGTLSLTHTNITDEIIKDNNNPMLVSKDVDNIFKNGLKSEYSLQPPTNDDQHEDNTGRPVSLRDLGITSGEMTGRKSISLEIENNASNLITKTFDLKSGNSNDYQSSRTNEYPLSNSINSCSMPDYDFGEQIRSDQTKESKETCLEQIAVDKKTNTLSSTFESNLGTPINSETVGFNCNGINDDLKRCQIGHEDKTQEIENPRCGKKDIIKKDLQYAKKSIQNILQPDDNEKPTHNILLYPANDHLKTNLIDISTEDPNLSVKKNHTSPTLTYKNKRDEISDRFTEPITKKGENISKSLQNENKIEDEITNQGDECTRNIIPVNDVINSAEFLLEKIKLPAISEAEEIHETTNDDYFKINMNTTTAVANEGFKGNCQLNQQNDSNVSNRALYMINNDLSNTSLQGSISHTASERNIKISGLEFIFIRKLCLNIDSLIIKNSEKEEELRKFFEISPITFSKKYQDHLHTIIDAVETDCHNIFREMIFVYEIILTWPKSKTKILKHTSSEEILDANHTEKDLNKVFSDNNSIEYSDSEISSVSDLSADLQSLENINRNFENMASDNAIEQEDCFDSIITNISGYLNSKRLHINDAKKTNLCNLIKGIKTKIVDVLNKFQMLRFYNNISSFSTIKLELQIIPEILDNELKNELIVLVAFSQILDKPFMPEEFKQKKEKLDKTEKFVIQILNTIKELVDKSFVKETDNSGGVKKSTVISPLSLIYKNAYLTETFSFVKNMIENLLETRTNIKLCLHMCKNKNIHSASDIDTFCKEILKAWSAAQTQINTHVNERRRIFLPDIGGEKPVYMVNYNKMYGNVDKLRSFGHVNDYERSKLCGQIIVNMTKDAENVLQDINIFLNSSLLDFDIILKNYSLALLTDQYIKIVSNESDKKHLYKHLTEFCKKLDSEIATKVQTIEKLTIPK